MRSFLKSAGLCALVSLFMGSTAHATIGTIQVPTCMTFLGNVNAPNSYTPCNGVVPIDSLTGNPLNWSDLFSGNVPASTAPVLGGINPVPAGSITGTPLGVLPTGAKSVRFYLGASDTVTFTIASAQPSSAPSQTVTISGATGGTGPNWDETLSGTSMIYVTALTGTPKFRWR